MNLELIAMKMSLYEKGLLTDIEFAVGLLLDLVSDQELDTAFISSIPTLPDGIKSELFALLRRIEQADFHWKPILIGPSIPQPEPPGQPERLRQIYSLVPFE